MLSILYRIIYPYGIGFFVFFFLTLLFRKQKAWRILWIVLMTGCVLCCCYFSMDLIKNDPVQTSAIFVDAHRGSMELTYWDLTFQNEQDGKFNLSYPSKYVSEFEPFIQYRLQYAKRTHQNEDESAFESDEYFAYIAGYTDDGFSYGITWEEAREIAKRDLQFR